MMCAINNREDLDKLEELASLQVEVKVVRLQDRLGKQNFHENMEKSLNLLPNHLKILLKI